MEECILDEKNVKEIMDEIDKEYKGELSVDDLLFLTLMQSACIEEM